MVVVMAATLTASNVQAEGWIKAAGQRMRAVPRVIGKGFRKATRRLTHRPKELSPADAAKLIKPGPTPVVEVALGNDRKATIAFKAGVGGHIKIVGGDAAVDCDLAEKILPNLKIEK